MIEEILMTKSALRSQAAHMAALDGINWQAIRAVEGEEKTELILEEAIAAEENEIAQKEGITVFEDNSFPGYGVNYDNLSCFRGRGEERFDINYNLLRQIWYGLNYAETSKSGAPHEILASMNTSEILSLYRAFARLIEYGNVELGKVKVTKEELKEMPAELAISKMVSYGCRHGAMITMKQRGWNHFPTYKGDLIKRIKSFGHSVKDRFICLLDNEKRTTEVTAGIGNPYDFHDPCYNADRPKLRGNAGRGRYIRAIACFMQQLYNENIKHVNS